MEMQVGVVVAGVGVGGGGEAGGKRQATAAGGKR